MLITDAKKSEILWNMLLTKDNNKGGFMKESVQNLKELKELLVVVDMVNGFVKREV